MKYIDVIIENNSDNTDRSYTYYIENDKIKIGDVVKVQFGRGKAFKRGFVFDVKDKLEEDIKGIKEAELSDDEIKLSHEIVDTCRWIRNRYLCRYIEAIKCFLPSSEKPKRLKKQEFEKTPPEKLEKPFELEKEQREAFEEISENIKVEKNQIYLLHGVTGSGKTEVYLRLAEETLKKNKTVILMEPEIALTTEIIKRFEKRFGKEKIAILHSKMTKSERYFQWENIKFGDVKIVIGARSAVFAPIENIGLIILDEEHETTYKADSSPKYDALEVAAKRAMYYKSTVVLGSATPSVVSYYRSSENIYKKIEMNSRYNNVVMPKIYTVDMSDELRAGNKSIFSRILLDKMKKNIEENKQIILFLNRRGYANFISCRDCGYVMKCKKCGISKTYHKRENAAICHYCGDKEPVLLKCTECGSKNIKQFGIGTEKIEEEVSKIFPEISVDRLDLDTIKKRGSIEKILKRFHKGESQILIGTQLVAKGLDFNNVGLVGIISADMTLNLPDFRSSERTFQLTTQAGGRAGRRDEQGEVVIQGYDIKHYSIVSSAQNDYKNFYDQEIKVRKVLNYPPFSHIIQIEVIGKEEKEVIKGSNNIYDYLRKTVKEDMVKFILPPKELLIDPINNHFRYSVLIKSPIEMKNNYLEILRRLKKEINTDKKRKYIISIDINPY